jgi:transposase InsO family protein
MNTLHGQYPVELMARVLEVSRSGYYAWRRCGSHARAAANAEFDAQVSEAFNREKRRCGRIRLTKVLHRQGIACGINRVARSLARQGLCARPAKKFIATTNSQHAYPVAPNLLQREFTVREPNRVWVTDITYLSCTMGWVYLVMVLDLFSRRIVGWSISDSLQHEAVLLAFDRAIAQRHPGPGLIVHSDRGIQYCCTGFREYGKRHRIVQSMSKKGDCWDNAVAESFFASLKKDLAAIDIHTFETITHAEQILFEYIEIDYNRHRLHSTLGYVPPVEFEELAAAQRRN